jgi:hypothetical protein
MPDARARSLPHSTPPVIYVGSSGGETSSPGFPAGVQPGDFVIGVMQDTANGTPNFAGAAYSFLARSISEDIWHGTETVVCGGYYAIGQTLTFTGAVNHNLTAMYAFRNVRGYRVLGTPSSNASSASGVSNSLRAELGEFVILIGAHGESSGAPALVKVWASDDGVERYPEYSTATGSDGLIFGAACRRARSRLDLPFTFQWNISRNSEMSSAVIALR